MKKVCKYCGYEVNKEVEQEFKKEYPYYCSGCDENMYSFLNRRSFRNHRRT